MQIVTEAAAQRRNGTDRSIKIVKVAIVLKVSDFSLSFTELLV